VVGAAELRARVEALAAWLLRHGLRRRDRVGIYLHPSIDQFVALLAVSLAGGVFVVLNHRWSPAQVARAMAHTGMRWLFTQAGKMSALAAPAQALGCPLIVREPGLGPGPSVPWPASGPVEPLPGFPALSDRDLAAILYTSGSTGLPKGVMISHRNFLDASHRIAEYLGNHHGDRVLALLPCSAPWGVLQLTTMLQAGGQVVLPGASMPAEVARSIRQHRVTGLAGLPPTWIGLVDYLEDRGETLPELRFVTTSGGVIPDRVLEAMPRVFPRAEVFQTYGLSEAFRSTLVPPSWFARKRGSLGRPCRNVDVFVVQPGKGRCGPGERGELVHRGAVVTLGYWADPEATAASFRSCPELREEISDEIVHYSGDIVEMDAEGFLWFVGRRDGLLKINGHRVSPEEIESAAVRAGAVAHAVAFGLEDQSGCHGICLAIQPARAAAFDRAEFDRRLRDALPSYQFPRKLSVWAEPMPLSAPGKVDRAAVIRRSFGEPET